MDQRLSTEAARTRLGGRWQLKIDLRWGGADIDFIRTTAAELVSEKPDVILVYSVRVLNEMHQATRQIPVVFIATSDPVGLGYVESLSRPAGNLPGSCFTRSLSPGS